jgi:hypothetical protein
VETDYGSEYLGTYEKLTITITDLVFHEILFSVSTNKPIDVTTLFSPPHNVALAIMNCAYHSAPGAISCNFFGI